MRDYHCGWNGCEKAYGSLSNLNYHIQVKRHGQRRQNERSAAAQVSPQQLECEFPQYFDTWCSLMKCIDISDNSSPVGQLIPMPDGDQKQNKTGARRPCDRHDLNAKQSSDQQNLHEQQNQEPLFLASNSLLFDQLDQWTIPLESQLPYTAAMLMQLAESIEIRLGQEALELQRLKRLIARLMPDRAQELQWRSCQMTKESR